MASFGFRRFFLFHLCIHSTPIIFTHSVAYCFFYALCLCYIYYGSYDVVYTMQFICFALHRGDNLLDVHHVSNVVYYKISPRGYLCIHCTVYSVHAHIFFMEYQQMDGEKRRPLRLKSMADL